MIKKVEEIAYHRNGICGTGFHVVKFVDRDKQRMVGIVFDRDADPECAVAVMDRDKLADGVIAFGANSYRGDQFAPELYKAIDAWEEERMKQFTGES